MNASDLYEILELEPAARPDEVRRAYFRLAKLYHPDLSTGGDDRESTERFLAIQEAYEILSDARKRSLYDDARRLRQPSATIDATATAKSESPKSKPEWNREPTLDESRDARKAYMRVEPLISAGDMERAAEVLRIIVKTVPDEPEYQSKYGYVLAAMGKDLHKARDYCRRAVQADPYNADYQAQLGFVYMKAGLGKTAMECFEEALAYDPTHELALANRRCEKNQKGGGLFSKLSGMFAR